MAEAMGGKLLLFGGGGFVGGHLAAAALRRGWEVHIAARRQFPGGLPRGGAARWHLLDIAEAAAARALISELQPQAVVDVAAVADIDRAEREQEAAWAVNVEAARTIASACAASGAYFLYFSSDAVFAGTASRYQEEDPPQPVNFYGRTKAEGEKAVLAADPRAGVVRLSLVLGFPVTEGNSFFAALEARLRAGQEVAAPADEIRTPVDVLTLTDCVLELIGLRFAGVLHIGSTDSMGRAEITRRAAELLGYPSARIVAGAGAAAPAGGAPAGRAAAGRAAAGRAARHKNGIIRVDKARALLTTPLLSAEQSIRRAIEQRPR
jgi:dTDP-4-dehydrorhamnose reductase